MTPIMSTLSAICWNRIMFLARARWRRRIEMRLRTFVGAIAVLASIAVGALSTRTAAAPGIKWALFNLTEPTSIAGTLVSGPVMFVHDDERMARGEPCTSVHRFVPGKGPAEELVAFHCKPRWTKAPDTFTSGIHRNPYGPRVLTSYQFAGDEGA